MYSEKGTIKKKKAIIFCSLLIITIVLFIPSILKGRNKKNDTVYISKTKNRERKSVNQILTNKICDFEGSKKFDRRIKKFMRYWDIKGASFALMKNDSLIYAKGYGYANKEESVKCDTKYLFRLASLSKLITASTIMHLVEENKLSLNDKVFGENGIFKDSIYCHIRDKRVKKITIEHLLRHRACFSSPYGDPAFNLPYVARFLKKELPLSRKDMVIYASRNRLKYSPGSSSIYSNLGYIVLTEVIEKVTGQDYEQYVQDSILAPAGCYDMHIGYNFPDDLRKNEVSYYDLSNAKQKKSCTGEDETVPRCAGGNDMNILSGAGGWIASSVEMLKFVAAINKSSVKPNILKSETIRKMTTYKKGYIPIGWSKVNSHEWYRSGSMAGTNNLIKKQRDGYTWIFFTNTTIWVGSKFYRYVSSEIKRDIRRVKKWPQRDLWQIKDE